jgi:uncharacterized protein (TIGR02466 family)
MKVHQLFSVPLLEFKSPESESMCPALMKFFLARETDQYRDDISRDTQSGALFESRFDLFYWKDPEIQPMVNFIHVSLAKTIAELNGYNATQMDALRFNYHAWYHVTRSGGFQSMHNHPNASWSGIFCVDPGVPANDPREGKVRIYDPRSNANMYMDPGIENLQDPYNFGSKEIQHEAGKLWIFPSYLMHEIFPYYGDDPRVVVAFNCWLTSTQKSGNY